MEPDRSIRAQGYSWTWNMLCSKLKLKKPRNTNLVSKHGCSDDESEETILKTQQFESVVVCQVQI